MEDLFTNRTPSPDQAKILDFITETMKDTFEVLDDELPEGRYKSLAKTKLEECSMWAKKAVLFS